MSRPIRLLLRPATDGDLDALYQFQSDPEANRVAAFGSARPTDREAYHAWFNRVRANPEGTFRVIEVDGEVVGSIFTWRDAVMPGPEVSYWIGRDHWRRGIATAALASFLEIIDTRPIYGRAAADNIASIRVLEKSGFRPIGRDRAHSHSRGEEVEELVLELP